MNRLPPWQIWLPRLLFATVVILAVQLGLGLAVRSFVIRSGKASFGTHVDVRSSRVSLFSKQIVLNDLHIVDPHKPAEDYLDADRCELEVAARPLLHRQLVVTGGRLSGLRFSVLGKETGKLTNAKAAPALTTWLRDDADVLARQWFDHLAGRLKRDVSNQFESVRRTQTFGAMG